MSLAVYDKKYRVKVVNPKKFNPVHDSVTGAVCYPAYFKIGERGWFLFETNDFTNPVHRLHTSEVLNITQLDNGFIVYTKNTQYWFEEICIKPTGSKL